MGGCVIPPGTAAMCQTGGEEESGSERVEDREGGGGEREKVVEGSRRMRKIEKEKNRVAGQRDCLAVLQLSVKMTYRTH